MSEPIVTRLFPDFQSDLPLPGLYWREDLRAFATHERAFIYTNFVSSIDGRISVSDDDVARGVPSALANHNDWRLYQELAAQADVVITSGRYVREKAAGIAGPMLTFAADETMRDIVEWRIELAGTPLPDVAVVSRALDFDVEAAKTIGGRVVALGSGACTEDRVHELEDAGVTVVLGRSTLGLTGMEIARGLFEAGYRTAFSAAGPGVAHTLIEDGVLDRLYVTQVFEVLGGRNYVTLNEGTLLDTPMSMKLDSLHLDAGKDGAAQLFAAFAAGT